MSFRCDQDVFDKGHSVAMVDGCMYRVEEWVQAVAKSSGQRLDWHYSGGIANVLYLGDHAKVLEAVEQLRSALERETFREPKSCGSCSGDTHRAGRILRLFDVGAHGPYRAGDALPPEVLAVDTH